MKQYQKMVVIFVDLLGTENNVKFEDKLFIHRIFHSEAKQNESRNLENVVYDRKVYSFSDCAYFFYYYKDGIEESRKDDMKLLQIAMHNTALSLLRILNSGYLVRGGIMLGDAYFDELGFFGPAVEVAYKLESKYAKVPIVALQPELGQRFSSWELSQTNMELVELLMTGRPKLVEQFEEKYFLNMFYQLEAFNPSLHLETEEIEINCLKKKLFEVISRDKVKCAENADVMLKLNWMEEYVKTKRNYLRHDIVGNGFSGIVSDE
ncbi:hypothetical protein CBW65_11335 [Tumebacillus avium]|uniref:Guanylate cyclase domain-containing protein n=1 Tax=Tumebacillus avium TaxID=1903704 RepID=A0A1Y0INX6_9BACL|nr:hypothetical protein [Tumebacillus avium]ARU61536.1 hypothetical protein CBW65_11335 [Tumebacillus avium]